MMTVTVVRSSQIMITARGQIIPVLCILCIPWTIYHTSMSSEEEIPVVYIYIYIYIPVVINNSHFEQ